MPVWKQRLQHLVFGVARERHEQGGKRVSYGVAARHKAVKCGVVEGITG